MLSTDISHAYATAEDCVEEAFSLLRQGKQFADAKEPRDTSDAASFAAGLRTAINAARSALTEKLLQEVGDALGIQSARLRLHLSLEQAKHVSSTLLHLLQKKGAEHGKEAEPAQVLIRTYLFDIAREFVQTCDFDKDRVLADLSNERNSVLKTLAKPENKK